MMHRTQTQAKTATLDSMRELLGVTRITKRYALSIVTGTTRCACGYTSAIYATALDKNGKYVSTDPEGWCQRCGYY